MFEMLAYNKRTIETRIKTYTVIQNKKEGLDANLTESSNFGQFPRFNVFNIFT